MQKKSSKLSKKSAVRFIILLGIVSLFADMTYDEARSISGQYLAVLAASGAVCCVAAGYVDFPLIAYHFEEAGLIPNVIQNLGVLRLK